MKNLFYKLQEKKWFFGLTLRFMETIMSKRAFEYWVWEMTPLPIGKPFLDQYWDGIKIAISRKLR